MSDERGETIACRYCDGTGKLAIERCKSAVGRGRRCSRRARRVTDPEFIERTRSYSAPSDIMEYCSLHGNEILRGMHRAQQRARMSDDESRKTAVECWRPKGHAGACGGTESRLEEDDAILYGRCGGEPLPTSVLRV